MNTRNLKSTKPIIPATPGATVKAETIRMRIGGAWRDEEQHPEVRAPLYGVDVGAIVPRGGTGKGARLDATILSNVKEDMSVVCEEILGPVMTLQAYEQIEPIFEAISDSPYGLQCGIFTNSLKLALSDIKNVRTGGVIVNGISRWRSDQMPYGGVKDSGIGREGPKFAILDMTEEKFFVLN